MPHQVKQNGDHHHVAKMKLLCRSQEAADLIS
jgi:hypothetical protein